MESRMEKSNVVYHTAWCYANAGDRQTDECSQTGTVVTWHFRYSYKYGTSQKRSINSAHGF